MGRVDGAGVLCALGGVLRDVTRHVLVRDAVQVDGDHQQYLSDAKNPTGYCGVDGTGLSCPVGVAPADG